MDRSETDVCSSVDLLQDLKLKKPDEAFTTHICSAKQPLSESKIIAGSTERFQSNFFDIALNNEKEVNERVSLDPEKDQIDNRTPVASENLSLVNEDSCIKNKNKYKFCLKTGLCYDVRMRFHATINPVDFHPEDPRRIYRIYKEIADAGLVEYYGWSCFDANEKEIMKRIPIRELTREEALLVHTENHWDTLLQTADMSLSELMYFESIHNSVYFNNESAFCARLSAGGTIETCIAVAEGKVRNAIAVVRPPGHHAEPDCAMGFCLFSNVAIAAKCVFQKFPDIQRILILDWDVHHGNGTQKVFYDDDSVLYISLHRYEDGRFYPGSKYGNYDKVGIGKGCGKTINIPWSCKGMGDSDYIYAFQKIVLPIAYEYNPSMVIISSGFDAAEGDEIGECFVTPVGYAHMTHMLMGLAEGKLVAVLEGGYNLDSISKSALAVTKTLIGEPPPELKMIKPSDACIHVVQKVIAEHSKYWNCITPTHLELNFEFPIIKRLDDVIRCYQTKKLFEEWQMISLPVIRKSISFFENQIICTKNFYEIDSLNLYIDWAIKNKYGLMDVNIFPLLDDLNKESYSLVSVIQELCIYIWDNHLEMVEAENIILIGVGQGCQGLVHLMECRDIYNRVDAIVQFYGNNSLKAVSGLNDEISDWYFRNSLVLTSNDHPIWNRPKRIKKKFGKVVRSDSNEINKILLESFNKVSTFICNILESNTTTVDS
ncbi:hypothetical protein PORY_001762 [Pneumocystis oryctolagi]|uniref:Uncharacterized protein n=1 Tax=Pneumocystis oryctolagi TaxID=42067 RepID=A0ACB7CCX1_9ASCO|nr:hypothetical protein PORY_001762 [Pneumocystis oryctolagi]